MQLLRLFTDESSDSLKAIAQLREAEYTFVTIPVSGFGGPELKVGHHSYDGLVAINMFINANPPTHLERLCEELLTAIRTVVHKARTEHNRHSHGHIVRYLYPLVPEEVIDAQD